MSPEERELLLLCSNLGDHLTPLSLQQYRAYADKKAAGVPIPMTERLAGLLNREERLEQKLREWSEKGVTWVTALDAAYPEVFLKKLKEEAPPVLYLLGDASLLRKSGISVVGSRELREANVRFAETIGRLAAESGRLLISGDAKGADRTAQNAALDAGGCVVSFILDSLLSRKPRQRMLYVSEEGPECHYTILRAHSRNRLIHCFGECVFVAQCTDGTGGSWSGSMKNLTRHWSPLYMFNDGSAGAAHLIREGAIPCTMPEHLESSIGG